MNRIEPIAYGQSIKFLLLAVFIDVLGVGIVIPLLPGLVKQLVQARVAEDAVAATTGIYVGVIATGYAMMQFIAAPFVGVLADRWGRRPVLLASMLGMAIAYCIQGYALQWTTLLIGRLLAGVFGASASTANAYIADISAPDQRSKNFGLMGAMFGLGFAIGPALGGALALYDLRLPFYVSAGLAAVNLVYGYFYLQESLPSERRRAVSLRELNPLRSFAVLGSHRVILGISVAVFLSSLAQRGLENTFVLYTNDQFGWQTVSNGLAFCLLGVATLVVQGGLVHPVIRRFGPQAVAIFSAVILAVVFLGYALVPQGWMIYLCVVVGTLGGMGGPALQSIIAGRVDASHQGRLQGAFTSLLCISSILAPLLFASGMFGYFTSEAAPFRLPSAPFLLGSMVMIASAIVLTGVFRIDRRDSTEVAPASSV